MCFTRELPERPLALMANYGRLLFNESDGRNRSRSSRGDSNHEFLYSLAATPEPGAPNYPNLCSYRAACVCASETGHLTKAVAVIEQSRGRARLSISVGRAVVEQLSSAERSEFEQVRNRIQDAQAELRLHERQWRSDYIALAKQLREAENALSALISSVRQRFPDFMPAATLDQIFEAASETPLIYIWATSRGGLALVVRRTKLTVLLSGCQTSLLDVRWKDTRAGARQLADRRAGGMKRSAPRCVGCGMSPSLPLSKRFIPPRQGMDPRRVLALFPLHRRTWKISPLRPANSSHRQDDFHLFA